MKRRAFLLGCGSVATLSIASSKLYQESLAVELNLKSIPSIDTSQISELVLIIDKLEIYANNIDVNSPANISINIELGEYTEEKTFKIFLDNDSTVEYVESEGSIYLTISDINEEESSLSGKISVSVNHPDKKSPKIQILL